MERRRYTLGRRAESQAETRRRIVQAAVDLHRSVGPARTSISAVAERAGVQRHTVYRHFPSEAALFRACREHFLGTSPPPGAARWRAYPPGQRRLRMGLRELYAYFAQNREMIGNVLRDAELVPVGEGLRAAMERGAAVLAEGWRVRDARALRSALVLATDFFAWRTLTDRGRLSTRDAAEIMTRMVAAASSPSRRGASAISRHRRS